MVSDFANDAGEMEGEMAAPEGGSQVQEYPAETGLG
jgi:hypothetical protein